MLPHGAPLPFRRNPRQEEARSGGCGAVIGVLDDARLGLALRRAIQKRPAGAGDHTPLAKRGVAIWGQVRRALDGPNDVDCRGWMGAPREQDS